MGDVVPSGGVEHWQMSKVMLGPACLCLQQACNSSTGGLTPSLLWCQLKMTNKIEKFQTLLFFFALACEKIFIKMHSTESRCVIGLEKILCASFSQDTVLAFDVTTNGTVGLCTKYCPESYKEVMPQMTMLLWMHSKLGHSGDEHVKLGRSYQNYKGLTQKVK